MQKHKSYTDSSLAQKLPYAQTHSTPQSENSSSALNSAQSQALNNFMFEGTWCSEPSQAQVLEQSVQHQPLEHHVQPMPFNMPLQQAPFVEEPSFLGDDYKIQSVPFAPKTFTRREKRRQNKEQKQKLKKQKKLARNRKRAKFIKIITGVTAFSMLIASVIVALFFLHSTVFVAKNIRIEGISKYTDADILTIVGIAKNQSLKSIDPNLIAKRIAHHSDLELLDFSFVYPNGIYMRLQEKTPVAYARSKGYLYFLDKFGDVVEKKNETTTTGDFIEISNCVMHDSPSNNTAQIKDEWQRKAYNKVMSAIVSANVQQNFSNLSILKDDSVYLTTKDNFVIYLGNVDSASQKVVNALAVKNYVKPSNLSGGRIDVSIPSKPVFSNEDNRVFYEAKYKLDPSPSTVYKNPNDIQNQNGTSQTESQDPNVLVPTVEEVQFEPLFPEV